jgi:hypothetical protein
MMSELADTIAYVRQQVLASYLDVSRPTIDSWEKEGVLRPRVAGTFTVVDVTEGVIAASVRPYLDLAKTRVALDRLRETGATRTLPERIQKDGARCDMVVDIGVADIALCLDNKALLAAVRGEVPARTLAVVQLGAELRRAVRSFWVNPERGVPSATRRRGRPSKRAPDEASVVSLRGR